MLRTNNFRLLKFCNSAVKIAVCVVLFALLLCFSLLLNYQIIHFEHVAGSQLMDCCDTSEEIGGLAGHMDSIIGGGQMVFFIFLAVLITMAFIIYFVDAIKRNYYNKCKILLKAIREKYGGAMWLNYLMDLYRRGILNAKVFELTA